MHDPNNRYSIFHMSYISGKETHEIVDAPTPKEAVKGLSIFKVPREQGIDEFLHSLPQDIEGMRDMFFQCDEVLSVIQWGPAK